MRKPIEALLVVDDDEALRRSAVKSLGGACKVLTAATSQEAIALVECEVIDVAVIDLVLRGASGLDLLVELKRSKPDLSAIMISGLFSASTVRSAFRAGALDCFDKPFGWKEIVDRLESEPRIEQPAEVIPSFDAVKREYYNKLIAAFSGNVSHAARYAGIHRSSLQRIKRRRPSA